MNRRSVRRTKSCDSGCGTTVHAKILPVLAPLSLKANIAARPYAHRHSEGNPPPHCHRFRSSVRYWIASITCGGRMFASPARSAIVRETFRIRS